MYWKKIRSLPVHHYNILQKHQTSAGRIGWSSPKAKCLQYFEIYWHARSRTKEVVPHIPTLEKSVHLPLLSQKFQIEQQVQLCSVGVLEVEVGGLPEQHWSQEMMCLACSSLLLHFLCHKKHNLHVRIDRTTTATTTKP